MTIKFSPETIELRNARDAAISLVEELRYQLANAMREVDRLQPLYEDAVADDAVREGNRLHEDAVADEEGAWVPFATTEVAFRYPGGSWGRKVCKTEKVFERFVEKLLADGAEFKTAKV